jgi:hypothetical protein
MNTAAEEVQLLARQHKIVARGDYASYLAYEITRIEGVEVDETLELIGGLMEADVLSTQQGVDLVLRHHRETSTASTAAPTAATS